ncbi:hypothetical protein C8R43DRAFT_1210907 [Mycena crocata]|nr:hypothetical protein C8R43DRAFT_1210907 [Mycena crocata]
MYMLKVARSFSRRIIRYHLTFKAFSAYKDIECAMDCVPVSRLNSQERPPAAKMALHTKTPRTSSLPTFVLERVPTSLLQNKDSQRPKPAYFERDVLVDSSCVSSPRNLSNVQCMKSSSTHWPVSDPPPPPNAIQARLEQGGSSSWTSANQLAGALELQASRIKTIFENNALEFLSQYSQHVCGTPSVETKLRWTIPRAPVVPLAQDLASGCPLPWSLHRRSGRAQQKTSAEARHRRLGSPAARCRQNDRMRTSAFGSVQRVFLSSRSDAVADMRLEELTSVVMIVEDNLSPRSSSALERPRRENTVVPRLTPSLQTGVAARSRTTFIHRQRSIKR